ncbi:hypothetical protein QCE47_04305 [Caballeronia sp. LZ025]|uniref:YadA family autotransporter adhesin n=1 Tax=Caballeronia TaxID=1827195 RepID=UPI001FD605EE|nr:MULTISPECIES: hypothetical protein [Caballeronia]MDR5731570.1 hypothetical protein [Caballeronia sp. LZ025]
MKARSFRFKPVMLAILGGITVLAVANASAGTMTGFNNRVGSWVTRDGVNVFGDNNHVFASGVMVGDGQTNGLNDSVVIGNYASSDYGSSGGDEIAPDNPNAGPATAIGSFAFSAANGLAAGSHASAQLTGVAVGASTKAEESAVAVGFQSNAGFNSVTIGANSRTFYNSVAIGSNASAEYGMAIGTDASSGGNGIAIGADSLAGGDSTAFGVGARADYWGTAVGEGATAVNIGSAAFGNNSLAVGSATAIGSNAHAEGAYSTAIGVGTSTPGTGSIAIGTYSAAEGDYSTAVGANAKTWGRDSVALGDFSDDGGQKKVVSVGSWAIQRRIINVADGIDGNDAVNVNQLNAVSQLVSQNTANILALQNSGTPLQSTLRAAAPVVGVTASGASGSLFAASGNAGETAVATGARATAMGANAQAVAGNSVALGADSVADRTNTVSVGSSGNERQITNVAAGTQGTDAVNVDQLNDKVAQSNAYTDQAVAGANAHTDQAIASAKRDLEHYSDRATASVLAIPSIPVLNAGEKWVGTAVGNYGSATAVGFAAAYQVTSNLNFGVGVSTANSGPTAVKAQAGYRW